MGTNDWASGRTQDHGRDAALSLADLTEQAGVTVRTVRYYIAEGLLPPPVTAGRQSAYTRGHLDRLRLIARLKEAYLPLREIRRQLAGLDDAAVRHLLEQDAAGTPPQAAPERATTSARAYLDQVLGKPQSRASAPGPAPLRSQPRPQASPESSAAPAPVDADASRPVPASLLREEPAGLSDVMLPPSPSPASPDLDAAPEPWRRVRLGDDAELLIRESAYQQRQDRIDWLIRWARRVFH